MASPITRKPSPLSSKSARQFSLKNHDRRLLRIPEQISRTDQKMSSSTPPNKETIREKMLFALVGFILTGVIGTMLTTWIQQRGWAWQNRVTKIEKDTENALTTYRSVSDLINARWHATYRLVRAIETGAPAEDWKSARDNFRSTDRDWALRYTNVAREIEFYVDTPFGVETANKLKDVWQLPCTSYALNAKAASGTIDANSGRVVLEVINHCHGRIKDSVDKLIESGKSDASSLDVNQRKALAETAYPQLDNLYRTNEVLRCVIFERALMIRRRTADESYWQTFFGISQPSYDLASNTRKCVDS
jgi:hypothetical protein